MILTSYYSFASKNNLNNCIGISRKICDWFPKVLELKQCSKLYPSWKIIIGHKEGKISDREYAEIYYNEVLKILDAKEMYKKLDNSILLCWEKSRVFCHRRLVARWFEIELGIKIKELE